MASFTITHRLDSYSVERTLRIAAACHDYTDGPGPADRLTDKTDLPVERLGDYVREQIDLYGTDVSWLKWLHEREFSEEDVSRFEAWAKVQTERVIEDLERPASPPVSSALSRVITRAATLSDADLEEYGEAERGRVADDEFVSYVVALLRWQFGLGFDGRSPETVLSSSWVCVVGPDGCEFTLPLLGTDVVRTFDLAWPEGVSVTNAARMLMGEAARLMRRFQAWSR